MISKEDEDLIKGLPSLHEKIEMKEQLISTGKIQLSKEETCITCSGVFQSLNGAIVAFEPVSANILGERDGRKVLKHLIFPSAKKETCLLDDNVFRDIEVIGEICLPNNLKSIGNGTFYNCIFKNLTLPSTLHFVGVHSFAKCKIEVLVMYEVVMRNSPDAKFEETEISKLYLRDKKLPICEFHYSLLHALRENAKIEDVYLAGFSHMKWKDLCFT